MRIEYKLLLEVIDDITLYIPNLINACGSVSELYYEDVTDETWTIFQQVLGGYEDLYKALQMTLADGQEHQVKWSEQLEEILNKIPNHFIQLNDDMNNNKYVAIGDALKYEWVPLLEDLLTLFKENS